MAAAHNQNAKSNHLYSEYSQLYTKHSNMTNLLPIPSFVAQLRSRTATPHALRRSPPAPPPGSPNGKHQLQQGNHSIDARHDSDVNDLIRHGVFAALAAINALLHQPDHLDDAHHQAARPHDPVDRLPRPDAAVEAPVPVQQRAQQQADVREG